MVLGAGRKAISNKITLDGFLGRHKGEMVTTQQNLEHWSILQSMAAGYYD